ncbi:MAG TPA: hypothetical protein PLV92_21550, partial [Pirellulaceae bacterium]|nr:hypothetical protein [Pirellulaceae bacterium]
QDDRVISVRIALFAEMMKGRPWTSDTLRSVGGTEGLGVTFLDETFSSPRAPLSHRRHEVAARHVLQQLLPDHGGHIKGALRSRADLLKASGYWTRPNDFDELMQILDGELRLITPTTREGGAERSAPPALERRRVAAPPVRLKVHGRRRHHEEDSLATAVDIPPPAGKTKSPESQKLLPATMVSPTTAPLQLQTAKRRTPVTPTPPRQLFKTSTHRATTYRNRTYRTRTNGSWRRTRSRRRPNGSTS